jgi:PAS domain S-box-containing protein
VPPLSRVTQSDGMFDHSTGLDSGSLDLLAQMPVMTLVWHSLPQPTSKPTQEPMLFFASPQLLQQTGYNQKTLLSSAAGWQNLFPEDATTVAALLKQPEKLPQTLEVCCRHASGSEVKLRLTLSRLQDNTGQAVLGCLESLPHPHSHSARQAQELLTAIIEASPLPVYSVSPTGLVTSWNPAAEAVFGFSQAEALGKPLPIVQPEHSEEFDRLRLQVLAGQSYQGIEVVRKNRQGQDLFLSLNMAPLYDHKGQANGILAVTEDITKRKQAEQELISLNSGLEERVRERTRELETEILQRTQMELQLKQTNAELAHAVRIKDEFLANMSHELRTPLTAILGLTELLLDKDANAQNLQFLNTIHDSGQHLLSLINDILDLAKIGAGHLSLRPEPLLLDDVCENSLRLVRQMALIKRQTLRYEAFPEPLWIHADRIRIKQILVNLLSNAVKFTWPGGQICLRTRLSEATQEVIIEVEDTGIGIASEDQEQIFKPFIQLDSGLNRHAGGTGLGLALVRHLTQLHAGKICVESHPGQGSRFALYLPWNPVELNETHPPTMAHPSAPRGQGERILLVEDQSENVFMLESYLSELGYEVQVAQTGYEAIQLNSPWPDLILLDIHLPGLNGYEVLNHLQAQGHEDIPVMALTALAGSGHREKILAAGAKQCLHKPFPLYELAQKMRELLAS